MKTWQRFAILSLFLIQSVVSEPSWYTAEDGTRFLIDTDYEYNWHQAWHECARHDAQLVVIDSEAKNLQIAHILKRKFLSFYHLWIGGNDAYGDRQDKLRPFYWSATGKQFSYTNWAEDQPDNFRNKEHCVHILDNSKLKWNDNSCKNADFGFICEEKRVGNSKENENKNKDDSINLKETQEQTTERDISLQAQSEQETTERDISVQPEAEPEQNLGYISFNPHSMIRYYSGRRERPFNPHTLRRLYSARREQTENLEKSSNKESESDNEKLKPALETNVGDVSQREESLAPQRTNPKLLAGQTTLNEESLNENVNSEESSTGINNKWKSIIQNSLRKAELDIFKSLFGTVNNISE